ncbi:MAG: TatD family hydrolase [Alphaproteobacteria bacterium]|nr:TatD family hydrolase [Alphaproteobacteria bacterium]
MWIDSHCHLNHANISELGTPAELIREANANAVDGMVTICCRIAEELDHLIEITNQHQNVWCSIGTHPHDAGNEAEKTISVDEIIKLSSSYDNIIGIGESGLDYYYDNSPRDDQAESFRKHIRACIETGLPLIVHTRDAEEDTLQIMKEEDDGSLKAIMHCFSGTQWLADKALEQGWMLSFSGIVTFKKAIELQDIAKNAPLDRILVETDAPYLAPTPLRGKTNQPAYVKHTGQFLADLHNITEEEMAEITSQNFFRVFDKAKLV